jgi:DNA-binding NtrC family response regulator
MLSKSNEKRRIFVVDDEQVIAWSLAMILHQQGFEAKSFTEPLAALMAARSEAPELLISDVVMPQLSGIELAIQLREFCPDCKVLLFSGQAATANLLDAARERGYDFEILAKPVHPEDLLRKIQSVTEGVLPRQPAIDLPGEALSRRSA